MLPASPRFPSPIPSPSLRNPGRTPARSPHAARIHHEPMPENARAGLRPGSWRQGRGGKGRWWWAFGGQTFVERRTGKGPSQSPFFSPPLKSGGKKRTLTTPLLVSRQRRGAACSQYAQAPNDEKRTRFFSRRCQPMLCVATQTHRGCVLSLAPLFVSQTKLLPTPPSPLPPCPPCPPCDTNITSKNLSPSHRIHTHISPLDHTQAFRRRTSHTATPLPLWTEHIVHAISLAPHARTPHITHALSLSLTLRPPPSANSPSPCDPLPCPSLRGQSKVLLL